MTTLDQYIDQVRDELIQAKNALAFSSRRVMRLEAILGNAEHCFKKEVKANSIRIRKLKGEKITKANETSFKKKSVANVPENEPESSVAGGPGEVSPGQEDAPKKSGWSLFS